VNTVLTLSSTAFPRLCTVYWALQLLQSCGMRVSVEPGTTHTRRLHAVRAVCAAPYMRGPFCNICAQGIPIHLYATWHLHCSAWLWLLKEHVCTTFGASCCPCAHACRRAGSQVDRMQIMLYMSGRPQDNII
jgi:hypothetical protein